MLPMPIPIPNWKLGTHFVRRVSFPTGREPPHYQEFLIMRVIRNFPLSGKGNRV